MDVFPSLRHIPPGFPGAKFHELAAKWSKDFNDMIDVPFSFAKELIVGPRFAIIPFHIFSNSRSRAKA